MDDCLRLYGGLTGRRWFFLITLFSGVWDDLVGIAVSAPLCLGFQS